MITLESVNSTLPRDDALLVPIEIAKSTSFEAYVPTFEELTLLNVSTAFV